MTENRKIKIAAFFDGRPGHEKQTAGILQHLQNKLNLDVTEVRVKKPSIVCYLVLLLKYYAVPFTKVDDKAYDFQMLIGTGTHTHLPMLLHKKKYGTPVVTCMTPAKYLLKKFDLIFSPQHDNTPERENIVKTTGPPNTNVNAKRHDENKVLILIGGVDTRSHHWKTFEIIDNIEKIIQHDKLKSYTISSSPRTPADTVLEIKRFTEDRENCVFYEFKNTPSGWVEAEYSKNRQVWVTADSISMVYEALSSGCKVGIIPVMWKKENNKFKRSMEFLENSDLVNDLQTYLSGKLERAAKQSLNEAERCAEIVTGHFEWKD